MVVLIDNYDSFVYNLARYVRELGRVAAVYRHDAITVPQLEALGPSHLILSPGPCTPTEAGVSLAVVSRLGTSIPILGVCLGHQCIGAAYGGTVVRARRPMHGKTSAITHNGTGIFHGLPNPFRATRYHSLTLEPGSIPPQLEVTATADDGEIMAVRHREYLVVGVQFHPESVLTEYGYVLLARFLGLDGAEALPVGADALGQAAAMGGGGGEGTSRRG